MTANLHPANDEVKRLQSCINDLVSVQALAGVWNGQPSRQIIAGFLEVLARVLWLEFAYARIGESIEGSMIEAVGIPQGSHAAADLSKLSQAVASWLSGDALASSRAKPNPIGAGEVHLVLLRLGLRDEIGMIVVGARRADFPTETETMLLRVAANQAAIGLQEARRLREQKQAADELEQQVAERTAELTAANEALRREITERRRVEGEQRKLASLVENSADFIGIATVEGEVLFVNRAGQKIVGLDGDEEVRATQIFDYVVEQDREFLRQQVLPAVTRDGQWQGEIRFQHFKTGAPIPMLPHLFFIKEPGSGRRIALATICRDITERRRAEEALRQAQAELAHVTRVMTLGELTASIAHEVNQPLGAIVTNGSASLRLLASDPPVLAEAREAVEAMMSDALRASEVIKRIRGLLNKNVTETAPLDLNEMIQEMIALVGGELGKHQVLLRTELAAELPRVLGDRVQLQQVLLNLILNANEAMSAAGCQPKELLISSQESQSDKVVVAVRDTGIGLDPQTAERIFDPFFTTKHKDGGLGLGLSISRTIIEAHGGRLWATPNHDKGTMFQFTLPRSSEPSA